MSVNNMGQFVHGIYPVQRRNISRTYPDSACCRSRDIRHTAVPASMNPVNKIIYVKHDVVSRKVSEVHVIIWLASSAVICITYTSHGHCLHFSAYDTPLTQWLAYNFDATATRLRLTRRARWIRRSLPSQRVCLSRWLYVRQTPVLCLNDLTYLKPFLDQLAGSPIILVFFTPARMPNSKANTLSGSAKYTGGERTCNNFE